MSNEVTASTSVTSGRRRLWDPSYTWRRPVPELIALIFEDLTVLLRRTAEHSQNDRRRALRRDISRVSRVCQLWAARLRPLLFGTLFLKSASDVRFLSAMLQSDVSSWLSAHIFFIDLWSDGGAAGQDRLCYSLPAWRVLLWLVPGLRRLSFDRTHSECLFPWRERAFLRTLQNTRYLYLHNARFHSLSTFFRALGSLPSLEVVRLFEIRWGSDAQQTGLVRTPLCRAVFERVRLVQAMECTDNTALVLIPAAASTRYRHPTHRRKDSFLPQNTLEVIEVVRNLYHDYGSAAILFSTIKENDDTHIFTVQTWDGACNSLSVSTKFFPATTPSAQAAGWQVHQLAIALGKDTTAGAQSLRCRDWPAINGVLANMPNVHAVDFFCGDVLQEPELAELADEVRAQLPDVAAELRTHYDKKCADSRELAPELFGGGWKDWYAEIGRFAYV